MDSGRASVRGVDSGRASVRGARAGVAGGVARTLLGAVDAGGVRALALLGALALLTRLPAFFVSFYSGDEATYSALASRILAGALPYAGAVDHKPPGIELTYAAVYALVGRNQLRAVRALLVVVVALTGLIVGEVAARGGPRALRRAGAIYVIASVMGVPGDYQAANAELFLDLPLALAALLVLDGTRAADARLRPPPDAARAPAAGVATDRTTRATATATATAATAAATATATPTATATATATAAGDAVRLVGAGALTALAGLYKYQAALAGAAWLLVVARRAPLGVGVRRAALLGVGFLGVAALYLGAFRVAGIFDDFVFWGWRFNFQYMATLDAASMVGNAAGYSAAVAAAWLPLLLLLVVVRAPDAATPVRPLAVAWLAAMLLAVAAGGRFTVHYYLMALPPLAVLAAPAIAAPPAGWPRVARVAGALAALSVAGWLVAAAAWYRVKPHLADYQRAYVAVGEHLRAASSPDDRVFVWGNSAEIYYFADRVMGTRFPFCNYHTGKIWGSPLDETDAAGTEAHIVPRAWDALLADLDRAPPRFIVDGGAGHLDRYDRHPIARYPRLARFVDERYRLDAVVAGVPVYRRR